MGKFTFHLIKKLTGIDIEQLQNDNEALLIKNQQLSFEVKDIQTRSHTDGFQRNNAKCLDEKGISRFVPHSSI